MGHRTRTWLCSAALLACAAASTGCISNILADGQIAATRQAAAAVNTIADFELQRSATEAGIAQFEGMHLLRPDNTDGLFLLTQAWGGYAFAFVEDAYEEATDRNDDDLATYNKKRARLAYDRAVFFGLELLSHRADGFDVAKKNANTLDAWLQNFKSTDDAENLFWTGYAWLSRVNLYKDDTAMVADLFVGVSMMERSVAIDPTLEHWSGTVALASYHARPAGEMDQAKQMFDQALAKTARKNLQAQLNYATTYACLKGDRAQYETLLNEVLAATDPDPEQRFVNLLAKRGARRALMKPRMQECGFDMSSHPTPPPPVPRVAAPATPSPPVGSATPPVPPVTPPQEVKSEDMIRRSLARSLALLTAGGALLAASPRPAEADTVTLTVGTLAPAESPWGKVFKVWKKAVGLRTNGAVDLQFFWNGQQGDEGAMVGKMRTGQLDGAAITANGLSMIYKDILVLQLPGLYRDWGKLDNARNGMRTRLDTEFDHQGFKVLGWGDVGMAHIMSKGFDVHTPDDLKHKNTFFIAGDPIEPMFYSAVGDVTPRQVSVPEILTGLTANTINVVNAPALAAEQLQWASRLDHINTAVTGIGIGALIFTSAKINSLPADAQTALLESGKAAGEALTVSIRNEDNAAFQRLKARMVSYDPSPSEQAAWDHVFADTRTRLRGATFNAAVFDEAVRLAQ